MFFESVNCRAFGPLHDRTLTLTPGLNIIYGPNEAGKSTWRAALVAGLCGRRRRRGVTTDDRLFAERHRPWDNPKEWAVRAVIQLADGRRIELSHDFAGGVENSAQDMQVADREVSHEIMNEGAPDGARWLGLDRKSFQSVACVRQSELLDILSDASALQTDLQRAATTARADETASAAVKRLEQFHREHVGTSRSPTKPLERSRSSVEKARSALSEVRSKHDTHRTKRNEIRSRESALQEKEVRVATASAVLAEIAARETTRKYDEAFEFHALFPGGAPRGSAQQAGLAERVATALERWRALPETAPPDGPSVAELKQRILSSETEENAILAARAERLARDAEQRLARAATLTARFPDGRPLAPGENAQEDPAQRVLAELQTWKSLPEMKMPDGLTALELEERIATSREEEKALVAALAERSAAKAQVRLKEARRLAALFPDGRPRTSSEDAALETRVASALQEWGAQTTVEPLVGPTGTELDAELSEVDAEALRLSGGSVIVKAARSISWRTIGGFALVAATLGALRTTLSWIGLLVLFALTSWGFARRIAKQATAQSRRRGELVNTRRSLERAVTARQLDERKREDDLRHQLRAERELLHVAADAGITADTPEAAVKALRDWLRLRSEDQATGDRRLQEWERLQHMLDGQSLPQFAARTGEIERLAEERTSQIDEKRLATAREQNLSDSQLEQFRQEAERKRGQWQTALGERRTEDRANRQRGEDKEAATRELVKTARSVGVNAATAESAFEALEAWQQRRRADLAEFEQRIGEWNTLQQLLQGDSLAQIKTKAADFRKHALERTATVDPAALATAQQRGISEDDIPGFLRAAEVERGQWRTQLGSRQEADRAHQRWMEDHEAAATALGEASRDADVSTGKPETDAAALEGWLERRRAEAATLEQRSDDWDRLQLLLAGRSLKELCELAEEQAAKARESAKGVDLALLAAFRERQISEAEIRKMGRDMDEGRGALQTECRQIEEAEMTLPDLANAEEALAAAEEERDRIEQLGSVLQKTITFLKAAEVRIHRDLAPVLRQGVLEWLARVTEGRYTDCRVNPQTLAVDVAGPNGLWRAAAHLSHGTAEQIYLLLRLALTRYLGKLEEPCPVILDDPMASSDTTRRTLLLNTLLTMSEGCQVVLFTHDEDVRRWAVEHLNNPSDHLEQLDTAQIPA